MAISITPAAAGRLQKLRMMRQTPEHILRVGVRGGGCSGLSYFLDIVESPEAKDKVFDFPDLGATVAIDRKSYLFLNGTEIDFEKSLMRTGFVFNNPIAGTSCSCGDSFAL
jgi:iron-sulfur cluster assembly protein